MSSVEDGHPASEPIARSRYTRTAVALHWAIAMLMLTVIPLGIYGANNDTPAGAMATGLHKPIGILILLLTLVRIGWRLGHAPPPLPSTLARPLRAFAQATHFAFYGLLLALPLSGWWMSSAFPKRYPIKVGELFEVPFLPVPVDLKVALAVHSAHVNLGLLTLCLIGLHVAAALKHHFVDRDDILLRMLLRRPVAGVPAGTPDRGSIARCLERRAAYDKEPKMTIEPGTPFRRIVTGHTVDNRAIIASDAAPTRVFDDLGEDGLVFYEVWNTRETPARIDRNDAEPAEDRLTLAPPVNGTRIRVLDIPPDKPDTDFGTVFDTIGGSDAHEAGRGSRHASFHRTRSIDYGIILSGEITMLVDDGEVTVSAGDIVVQRGTNHGWVNRTDRLCRIAFVLIDGAFEDGLD